MAIDLSTHESNLNRKTKKVTKKFLKKFWKTIRKSYPGGYFPKTIKDARNHTTGDILADFVMLEMHDAIEGEEYIENAVISSIRSMTMAINDLQSVKEALVNLLIKVHGDEAKNI